MAVRLEATIKRFIGKAADVKPTVGQLFFDPPTGEPVLITAKDLPAGSTFLEEDVFLPDGTQRIARWDGTAWTYPSSAKAYMNEYQSAMLEALEAVRAEVELLRVGMIDAGACTEISSLQ